MVEIDFVKWRRAGRRPVLVLIFVAAIITLDAVGMPTREQVKIAKELLLGTFSNSENNFFETDSAPGSAADYRPASCPAANSSKPVSVPPTKPKP